MKPYALQFVPVFKHRIWGGAHLQEWFPEYPESREAELGEAWILSDHAEGRSVVANGPYAGKTLTEVIAMEPGWFPESMSEFPLLFKIIDAAKDLSVQVHPDDAYGFAHAGEQGKTECWWVLDSNPDARIVYGHHAQTRAEFEQAVNNDDWDNILAYKPVNNGDFWFVPAGKVHALGAGTMVLEVQQSSDTTYRVYDYNRRDKNGQLRDLHLDDAYNVITFPDTQSEPADANESARPSGLETSLPEQTEILADCSYFRVASHRLTGQSEVLASSVTVVCPIDASIEVETSENRLTIGRGSAALLPQGLSATLRGTGTVLFTILPN